MSKQYVVAGKKYELPEGLTLQFLDQTKTYVVLKEDPKSPYFGGQRLIDSVDVQGYTRSLQDKQHDVVRLLLKTGGRLVEARQGRPHRPTEEFLAKIGIKELPEDVDVTFQDGGPLGDIPPRAFHINKVDDKGQTELATFVLAWETAVRPKEHIYCEIKQTLVSQFGAKPATYQ